MNIYDFDGTIYDGDSSKDFYRYCIKKNKKCLLILPKFAIACFLYLIKMKDKEYLKSKYFSFIKYFENIDKIAGDFWEERESKIKSFYLNNKQSSDIIISASPEFLIKPIAKKLGFKLIATKVNKKTGELIGKNCHGEEKIKRLKQEGITKCNQFYSDSLSDEPCSKIAKEAFIVKKEELIPWQKYKNKKNN